MSETAKAKTSENTNKRDSDMYTPLSIGVESLNDGTKTHTDKLNNVCFFQLKNPEYITLKTKLAEHLGQIKNNTIDNEIKEIEFAIKEFEDDFKNKTARITANIETAKTRLNAQKLTKLNTLKKPLDLDILVEPIKSDLKNINRELKVFTDSKFFTRKGILHGPEQIVDEFRKKIKKKSEDAKIILLPSGITGTVVIKSLLPGKKPLTYPNGEIISIDASTKIYKIKYTKDTKVDFTYVPHDKVCLVE